MKKPSKLLLYKALFYFLLLPFITFLISDFVLPYSGITTTFYQTPHLVYILIVGLLGIPSSLTSLIASIIAIQQTRKTVKQFILYWLIPTIIALVFDSISKLPTGGGSILFFFIPWTIAGIIATGIIGVSIGKILIIIKQGVIKIPKNPTLSISFLLRVISFTLLLGLFFSLLTGVFVNTNDLAQYTNSYQYYIHRGIPIPFSGITRKGYNPVYPILTLPIFSEKLDKDTFIKTIQFSKFLQSLAFYMLLTVIPALQLATITSKRKQFIILLIAGLCCMGYMFYLWGHVIV